MKPAQIVTGIIIAALAITAGIWSARAVLRGQAEPDDLSATRFPVAREIQPFELIDHHQAPFNKESLQGRWSFLFFGYTSCPDVCPTTLSVLNSVAQRVADVDDEVRFAMVTIDPARDTPERLADFVTYFNGDFIGVTGSDADLQQLTRQLGILYNRVEAEPGAGTQGGGYLMNHTAGVFLFDPDGRYHAVFTPPLSAEKIADDFHKMQAAFR